MRIAYVLAAAAVAAAAASPAFAGLRTYRPADTSFTATGSVTITSPTGTIACHAAFGGATVGGAGSITSATLSGSSACAATTATGLPWTMQSYSSNGINLTHMGFSGAAIGVCGPGYVKGNLGTGGKLTFTAAGMPVSCSISGTLPTNPNVSVQPN